MLTVHPGDPVPVKIHDERLGEKVPILSNAPNQWIAASGMILRVLVGSGVHGTAIEGQDDEDQMGIAVERPESTLGLRRFDHYEFRTQAAGVCSGPGDLDLMVYSLRRYCGLAAKGNATVLLPLFVPESAIFYQNELGRELRENREMFLSKQVAERFKGYLHGQRLKLLGLRSGGTTSPGRAPLRAETGYDCKLAMHMLRLGYQGNELLRTGKITLPMAGKSGEVCRSVRRGEKPGEQGLQWCLTQAESLERRIDTALTTTKLADAPDYQRLNSWLVSAHLRHWKEN